MESCIGEATELSTVAVELRGSSTRCGDGKLIDLLGHSFLDPFGNKDFPISTISFTFPQSCSLLNHPFLL